MIKTLGLEKTTGEYIECLIFQRLWGSRRCWKTEKEVKDCVSVRELQYKNKKDKKKGLRDNIDIRFKGLCYEDYHTILSYNRQKKIMPELYICVIEIV